MRRKTLIYVLTFSLALNGATAVAFVFFWWQNQTLAAVSLDQKPIRSFLQQDMDLTTERLRGILGDIDRNAQEVAALRRLMDSKRAEMISLICSASLDKDAVVTKMDEIDHIQGKIRSAAVTTVITILESLPRESQAKFRAYLQARGRACDGCGPLSPRDGKAILCR
jgi:Spy/CpxP family protein refolding chaperone